MNEDDNNNNIDNNYGDEYVDTSNTSEYNAVNTYDVSNSNYGYYNPDKPEKPWKRIIFILLGLVVLFFVVILLMKACTPNASYHEAIINAGKEYYVSNENSLPAIAGDCGVVNLNKLMSSNLIKNRKNYEKCSDTDTYVKVCKLESGTYQYTSFVSCGEVVTEFDPWTIGEEVHLIPNKTDIRFNFLGEKRVVGTKYYYPNDVKEASNVKEYYVSEPSAEYKEKELVGVSASKWYTEKTETVYWNNGAYSAVAPEGYPNKGSVNASAKKYTITEPAEQAGRETKNITLYRYKKVAYPYKYKCTDSRYPTGSLISDQVCETRPTTDYKVTSAIYYSCNGTTQVTEGTVCADYTAYTPTACENSISKGIVCESKAGYEYVDSTWKWYKNDTIRSYYPSLSSSADGEKTYYTESPVSGSTRDESTTVMAYKYYKLIDETTGSIMSGGSTTDTWVSVTNSYVTEEELITKFQEAGFNVSTLSDVIQNELIRYKLQLQYRNRK